MRRLAHTVGEAWVDAQVGPVTRHVFDSDRGELIEKPAQPRFISGPIPFEWMHRANQLPGKAAQVAIALCFLRGVKKSLRFKVTEEAVALAGCTRQAYYNALKQLASAGLIEVDQGAGRRAVVTLREFQSRGE